MDTSSDIFERVAQKRQQQPHQESGDIFERVAMRRQQESQREQRPSIARKLKEPIRHVTRTGFRVAETIGGIPAGIRDVALWMGDKLEGLGLPGGGRLKPEDANFAQRAAQWAISQLPTQQELQAKSSKLSGGLTDPQGPGEEFSDEVFRLSAALAIPMKDPAKFASWAKLLGTAVAGVTAKEATGLFTDDPKIKAGAELGTVALLSLMGSTNPNALIADRFTKARSAIPAGQMTNTLPLAAELKTLSGDLSRGVSTPSKSAAKSVIEQLEPKASSGAMEVAELAESYHNINELMSQRNLFGELSKTEARMMRSRLNQVKSKVYDNLQSYGKNNKTFWRNWTDGLEAKRVYEGSQRARRFLSSPAVQKSIGGTVAYTFFHDLISLGPVAAAGTAAKAGAAIVPLTAAYRTGQVIERMARSPVLRQHYLDALRAASQENAAALVSSVSKMDKSMKEDGLDAIYREQTQPMKANGAM